MIKRVKKNGKICIEVKNRGRDCIPCDHYYDETDSGCKLCIWYDWVRELE